MQSRSDIPGIHWPAIAPRQSAAIMAMLYQFDRSQWLSPEQIQIAQFGQLRQLIQHAWQTVPFYRDRLEFLSSATTPETLRQRWDSIPILTRNEVQASAAALTSTRVPHAHGAIHSLLTSGSTGQPLQCQGTQITRFFWQCVTLRDHHWHRRIGMSRCAGNLPCAIGNRVG
jgi:phenylacetate-CoA ligase